MIDMNYLKKYHSAWLPLSVQPYHFMLGFTLQPFLGAQSMLLVAAYGKSYWNPVLIIC